MRWTHDEVFGYNTLRPLVVSITEVLRALRSQLDLEYVKSAKVLSVHVMDLRI
jgi:hypothetical protein